MLHQLFKRCLAGLDSLWFNIKLGMEGVLSYDLIFGIRLAPYMADLAMRWCIISVGPFCLEWLQLSTRGIGDGLDLGIGLPNILAGILLQIWSLSASWKMMWFGCLIRVVATLLTLHGNLLVLLILNLIGLLDFDQCCEGLVEFLSVVANLGLQRTRL